MSDMTPREVFLANLPSGDWKINFSNPEGFGSDFQATRKEEIENGLQFVEKIDRKTTEDKTKEHNWLYYKASFELRYEDSVIFSYETASQTTMEKAFRQARVKARRKIKDLLKSAENFFSIDEV